MKKVGFLGCGKIGKAMLNDLLETNEHEISFVQDPLFDGSGYDFITTQKASEELLGKTDLVIEASMASVLKENIDVILKSCDLMVFSVTAFADEEFYEHAVRLAKKYGKTIYLPHGAILGVDGIADGRQIVQEVSVETIKSPKSLGLTTELFMKEVQGEPARLSQEM